MTQRTQIYLDREEHRRARHRAAELGVSLTEYIRRLVHEDLEPGAPRGSVKALFELGESGSPDISDAIDAHVGEAVEGEYLEETRRPAHPDGPP